jgi:hypothetical protein
MIPRPLRLSLSSQPTIALIAAALHHHSGLLFVGAQHPSTRPHVIPSGVRAARNPSSLGFSRRCTGAPSARPGAGRGRPLGFSNLCSAGILPAPGFSFLCSGRSLDRFFSSHLPSNELEGAPSSSSEGGSWVSLLLLHAALLSVNSVDLSVLCGELFLSPSAFHESRITIHESRPSKEANQ